MNLAAIVYCVVLHQVVMVSLTYRFAMGMRGALLMIQTPTWMFEPFVFSIYVVMPLMPLSAVLLLRLFGQKVRWTFLVLAVVGMLLSVPVSIGILEVIDHKGSHDFIHAIKSGVLLPFWFYSMGLVVAGVKRSNL